MSGSMSAIIAAVVSAPTRAFSGKTESSRTGWKAWPRRLILLIQAESTSRKGLFLAQTAVLAGSTTEGQAATDRGRPIMPFTKPIVGHMQWSGAGQT